MNRLLYLVPVRLLRCAATPAAAAACAALLLAATPLQAATAPASDLVYRSIETPFPTPLPVQNYMMGLQQFSTVAAMDYGLTVRDAYVFALPLGSFQNQASGVSLSFVFSEVTATMRSSADLWARVQDDNDPIAFTELCCGARYVHVAALGRSTDVTLLTLTFSRPVQGLGFVGAGMSDYGPTTSPGGPSQRVQLDNRPMIDVIGVPTNTVVNPLRLSFGVIAAQPFSQVRLVLPGNSANDNAAIVAMRIAYAPLAPVPEPASWALMLAGAAVLVQRLSRVGTRRSD